jgi:hypothetical protein
VNAQDCSRKPGTAAEAIQEQFMIPFAKRLRNCSVNATLFVSAVCNTIKREVDLCVNLMFLSQKKDNHGFFCSLFVGCSSLIVIVTMTQKVDLNTIGTSRIDSRIRKAPR